jgi:hypothetical protein
VIVVKLLLQRCLRGNDNCGPHTDNISTGRFGQCIAGQYIGIPGDCLRIYVSFLSGSQPCLKDTRELSLGKTAS